MNTTFIRFDEPLPVTPPPLTLVKQDQAGKKEKAADAEDISVLVIEEIEAKIEITQNEKDTADKKYLQQHRELTKQRMPEKSKEKQLQPWIQLKKQLDQRLRILKAWVDKKTPDYKKVPLDSKYRHHIMQKLSNQVVLDAGRTLVDKDSHLLFSVGETILTPTNQTKLANADSSVKKPKGRKFDFKLAQS